MLAYSVQNFNTENKMVVKMHIRVRKKYHVYHQRILEKPKFIERIYM